MRTTGARLDGPTDFSLVQGGPLFQLLLRARLVRPSMDLLARRMLVIAALTWVPLLVLTLLSGNAFGGVGLPFLYDLAGRAVRPGVRAAVGDGDGDAACASVADHDPIRRVDRSHVQGVDLRE